MLIADGVKRFAESSAGSQVDGVSGNLSLPRLYLIAISQPLAALTYTRLVGLIKTGPGLISKSWASLQPPDQGIRIEQEIHSILS
jgi:hypothetical protein